jgi:hypothetical protein
VRLAAQKVVDRRRPAASETRAAALAELDLEIAAARDLDRVLERLRQVGEQLAISSCA